MSWDLTFLSRRCLTSTQLKLIRSLLIRTPFGGVTGVNDCE